MESAVGADPHQGRDWAISQIKTHPGQTESKSQHANPAAPNASHEKTTTPTTTTHDSESTSEDLLPTQSLAYGLREAQVAGVKTEAV